MSIPNSRGGRGRPLLPYTVMIEPLCCHSICDKPQSMASCMLCNHGVPKITSVASGTTQKLRVYTTPSANLTRTACAKPRLACVSPSGIWILSLHILSMGSLATAATFSLTKLWLAPLSIKVNPQKTGALLLPNQRSSSNSLCSLDAPCVPLTAIYPIKGCSQ